MNKSVLERLLNKYNLNGVADKVTWIVDKKEASVRFISDDHNVVGEINTSGVDLQEGSYSVFETSNLKRLLSTLDDEIKIKVQSTNGKNTGLVFSDSSSTVTFVLADVNNIPSVPDIKSLPAFDVVLPLNTDLMERYVKSCGALPDAETFTVTSDGKKSQLVLGFTNINSNRVTINVDPTVNNKMKPTSFHARYFKDIIIANKEAADGELSVSEQGIAKVTFKLTDFKVVYYLPQIKVED